MKSIAASLFNFLDKKQTGKVTFNELVEKLYPNLSKPHLDIVKFWIHEYNQNFNL
jgi:Ca2+-binding EF-hand superfamily protein